MKKIYLIITLSLILIFKGEINAQCPVSIQAVESSGLVSNDTIICNGDQAILIASGGVTFLWSTGATATSSFITVMPNTTTTYTVTITDTLSVSCSASVQITVNPLPTVSAGNVSGCTGTPIALSGSPSGGTFSVPNPYTGSSTTYTYSYNDGNGCSNTSSSANIIVNALPIALITESDNSGSTNDDNIICLGDNATLDATHPSGTTYLWSNGATSATITVSPALDSTYTVTVTSAYGCSATSSLLITVNPLPSAQIFEFDNSGTTANDSIICNGSFVTLTACCGAGYLWGNGAITATISDSPTANTTYTVTVTSADGCTSSASVLITVNTLPNAVIAETDNSGTTNNDGIIILGSNATLTASGGVAYLWSNGITVAANTVSPGPAGTYAYTVTVTNANGCSATASSTITVLSSSAASITETDNSGSTANDGIICAGGSATLTATALNDSLFLWSNGSSASAITVSPLSTTTYTVTITDVNNATSTSSVQITVKSLPIVTIIETDNSGVAPNDSIIIAGFNATLTATGGGTYLWSNGTTTAATIVTPATTTTYTVTVTSADGCSKTASIQITVLDSSAASIQETDNSGATNDNIICFGDSATLTVFALDSNLFLWSNGATTVSINVSPVTTTTYTVTVTNNNGATSSASVQIDVKPLPVAVISVDENSGALPDDSIICRGDNATLTASGGAAYLWDNSATTASITVSPTSDSVYTVTVTSADGCSSTTTVLITVKSLPVAQIFEFDNSGTTNNDNIIISGDTAILTACCGATYSWNIASSSDTIKVSPPLGDTTYTVTVTSADSCSSTDTIKITVLPAPSASITITESSGSSFTDSTICLGDGATLKASLGSGSTAISYLWSNGATIDSIIVYPTVDTTFTVIVTDTNGASSTASKKIIVEPLPSDSILETDKSGSKDDDSTICEGGNATLKATGGVAWLWSDGTTLDSIVVSPTSDSIFTVTVKNADSCSSTASILITVNPPPIISIIETDNSGSTQNDGTICLGDTAILAISGGVSYSWSNGSASDTTKVYPQLDTTTYTVTVISSDGCSSTDTVKIIVKDLPKPLINVSDSIICFGDNATLTASDTGTGGMDTTFLWSNGASTALITVSDSVSTTYTVTVTNSNGCTKTASKLITVKPKLNGTIIGNDTVCQNDTPPEVTFQGYYGTPPYTFTYIISGDTNTYTKETSDSTSTVAISNPTLVAGSFTYILISVEDKDSCSQDVLSGADSSSATILINPAPGKPVIVSLVNDGDTVCAGSTNINFNVSNPQPGVSYTWHVTDITNNNLRDSIGANTVISFGSSANSFDTITVTAADSNTLCSNTGTITLYIKSSADAIDERKIILKQPGNLLVYPDNSMDQGNGYQWGYDSISNDTVLGPPIEIPGQVYQIFIPGDSVCTKTDPKQLDTLNFAFWVLLKNFECQSKVYYNGPYKFKPHGLPIVIDSTVALTVFPNPTTGDINILLQGKIYGSIDAKIYNALGQVVYKTRFEKKQIATTQNIKLNKIPEGVYLLELISSDHQKVTTRIIVYH